MPVTQTVVQPASSRLVRLRERALDRLQEALALVLGVHDGGAESLRRAFKAADIELHNHLRELAGEVEALGYDQLLGPDSTEGGPNHG